MIDDRKYIKAIDLPDDYYDQICQVVNEIGEIIEKNLFPINILALVHSISYLICSVKEEERKNIMNDIFDGISKSVDNYIKYKENNL